MDQNLPIEQSHFFLNQRSAVNDVNFLQTLQSRGVLTRSENIKIVFRRWGSLGRSPDPLVGWWGGYPLLIPHRLDAFGVSFWAPAAPRSRPPSWYAGYGPETDSVFLQFIQPTWYCSQEHWAYLFSRWRFAWLCWIAYPVQIQGGLHKFLDLYCYRVFQFFTAVHFACIHYASEFAISDPHQGFLPPPVIGCNPREYACRPIVK